jgi:leucyl aminopeptidase
VIQVTAKAMAPGDTNVDLIAIPVEHAGSGKTDAARKRAHAKLPRECNAFDAAHGGVIAAALASGDFTAARGQTLVVYPIAAPKSRGGGGSAKLTAKRILLIGLGDTANFSAEDLRRIGALASNEARTRSANRLSIVVPKIRGMRPEDRAAALAEGVVLGQYRFDAYLQSGRKRKGAPAPRSCTLVFDSLSAPTAVRRRLKLALIGAHAQNTARDLSNAPGNALPPSELARAARRIAKETGLTCKVMRKPELERRGFHGLLAVGQGSSRPPHLIVLEHRGAPARQRGSKPVCLIGKGITFDSGGISIKPSANMGDMKHDMSGAATVIGTMQAIAKQGLPLDVIGVVAAAENMPGSSAYRPGDIIESYAGKTIEVQNTDAEGRIVLADALAYAKKTYAPAAMIDIATLTGAAMVAFGPWATGAMGNDDALVGALNDAGKLTGEPMWPMPLFDAHRRAMRSTVADLKNTGGRDAGISTAAGFLAAFVGETPWVHLDIAGSANTGVRTPYHRGGATGVGVRTLVEWLRART